MTSCGGDGFVPEEEAIQIALDYVTPLAEEKRWAVQENSYRCKISAQEDDLFYEVEIDALDGDYPIIYTAWVDVYDGEVLFWQFTQ